MKEMTPRRRAILGLVIRSYIASATPVGSKAFVEGYGLGLSPATIRNEMAALEDMGYLTHRHTSAGRVPTELGYRFFVEHLVGETELPVAERLMIRHQFHQARTELDQWARLAAAVLAHTTRNAAVATPPRVCQSQFKHLELINLHDSLVLLVLVLEGGMLKQQMLFLDEPLDQDTLSRLSNQLNEQFEGKPGAEITRALDLLPALEQQIGEVVVQTMAMVDGQSDYQIYRDGLLHMLREPEFSGTDTMRQLVEALEGSSLLDVLHSATQPLEVGGVQVLIGGEGRFEDFNDLSLVLSRYGVEGGATGLLGIVGPTRMPYDRSIGAIRYVSAVMTDLVSDWYGGREAGGGLPN